MLKKELAYKKNKETRRVVSNSLYNVVPAIVTLSLAIFVTPFLLTNLTPNIYGVWVLIGSIAGPIALLEFGTSEAAAKYIAASEERGDHTCSNNIISSVMLFNIAISIVGIILIFCIAYFLPEMGLKIELKDIYSAQISFYITGIGFAIIRIIGVYEGVFKAVQDFKTISIVTTLGRILYSLSAVMAILLGHGLIGVVMFQTVSYFIILIIWIIRSNIFIPQFSFFPSLKKDEFLLIFKYGGWNTLGRVSSVVMQNIDKIVLGALVGTVTVAYFNTAFLIYVTFFMIAVPFSSSLMPYFSVLEERGVGSQGLLFERLRYSVWLLSNFVIILSIPFFVFSYEVLEYWINKEAANQMSHVLRFLILANWISSLNIGLGQFILGVNLVKYNAMWGWMRGALSTILTIVLIDTYGIAAAGLGGFISQFSLIWLIYIVWKVKLTKLVNFGNFIKIFIQPLTVGLIVVVILLYIKSLKLFVVTDVSSLIYLLFSFGIISVILTAIMNYTFPSTKELIIKTMMLVKMIIKT